MFATTKPRWSGSDLRAALATRLDAPVAVDTDVNSAAFAERQFGSGRGAPTVAYLTVGTGISEGLSTSGQTLTNALHPEVGHIRLVRDPADKVPSTCPFHKDCAEGLAAGPAIARRLAAGHTLEESPVIAALIADYIAQLIAILVRA